MNARYIVAFAGLLVAAPAAQAASNESPTHETTYKFADANRQSAIKKGLQAALKKCDADRGLLESLTFAYQEVSSAGSPDAHIVSVTSECKWKR